MNILFSVITLLLVSEANAQGPVACSKECQNDVDDCLGRQGVYNGYNCNPNDLWFDKCKRSLASSSFKNCSKELDCIPMCTQAPACSKECQNDFDDCLRALKPSTKGYGVTKKGYTCIPNDYLLDECKRELVNSGFRNCWFEKDCNPRCTCPENKQKAFDTCAKTYGCDECQDRLDEGKFGGTFGDDGMYCTAVCNLDPPTCSKDCHSAFIQCAKYNSCEECQRSKEGGKYPACNAEPDCAVDFKCIEKYPAPPPGPACSLGCQEALMRCYRSGLSCEECEKKQMTACKAEPDCLAVCNTEKDPDPACSKECRSNFASCAAYHNCETCSKHLDKWRTGCPAESGCAPVCKNMPKRCSYACQKVFDLCAKGQSCEYCKRAKEGGKSPSAFLGFQFSQFCKDEPDCVCKNGKLVSDGLITSGLQSKLRSRDVEVVANN